MTRRANDHGPEDHAVDASGLLALVAELQAQNATLAARVAELERQLWLNSGNSGKPPSRRRFEEEAGARRQPSRTNRQEDRRAE